MAVEPTTRGDGRRYRSGFILPMVVLAALAILLFIAVISNLGQSSRDRIKHLNKAQTAFHIGYSALGRFLAQLHQTSWAGREFKDAPQRQFGVSLLGGEFDLHAENTPGLNREFQTDVYVRVRFADMIRLYFWRLRYQDDLLDISNRCFVKFFAAIPLEEFPGVGGSTFASKIDRMLTKRAQNHEEAEDLALEVQGVADVQKIVQILGHHDPRSTNTPEFPTRLPANGPVLIAGVPPIPFPSAQPDEAFNDSPLTPTVPILPSPPPPTPTNPNPAPTPSPTTPATPPPPTSPTPPSSAPPPAPPAPPPPAPAPRAPTSPTARPPALVAPPARPPAPRPAPPQPKPQPIDTSAYEAGVQAAAAWVNGFGSSMVGGRYCPTSEQLGYVSDPEVAALVAQHTAAFKTCSDNVRTVLNASKKVLEAIPLAKVGMTSGALSALNSAFSELQTALANAKAALLLMADTVGAIGQRVKEILEEKAREEAEGAGTSPSPGGNNLNTGTNGG